MYIYHISCALLNNHEKKGEHGDQDPADGAQGSPDRGHQEATPCEQESFQKFDQNCDF